MSRLSGQFKYRKKKNFFKALHQQWTRGKTVASRPPRHPLRLGNTKNIHR